MLSALQASEAIVRPAHPSLDVHEQPISCSRTWHGKQCFSTVTNQSEQVVKIREIVLFAGPLTFDPTTCLYGEGFQMLSQTAGTLGAPVHVGNFTDQDHYRLLRTPGALTVYNMVTFSPEPSHHILLGFTSCHRFSGFFRLWADHFEVVLDTEDRPLAPHESWELEGFFAATSETRHALLDAFAQQITQHHPQLPAQIPTGWCSWYCYGPEITEQAILDHLLTIRTSLPQLTHIQIDDGYASALGDWLLPGPLFASGMEVLCQTIRANGCEPAIWVAPFIAEASSALVHEHPDWFVQQHEAPLASDQVSFGGWRNGPWYMLDGTHPEAQNYLEIVFRTMREVWGCRYFKLDALMWGAMSGGQRFNPSATRIEAYRQGMKAILRGAGETGFILGCNAPFWPSLGLVHGMRVSGDITRSWSVITSVARECFWRGWQHNRLWINDPDCVLLENTRDIHELLRGSDDSLQGVEQTTLSRGEFFFHAAVILASGGSVLSGDNLLEMSAEKRALFHKLLPPQGRAAIFEDSTFRVGKAHFSTYTLLFFFNWDADPQRYEVALPGTYQVNDYWTGEDLGLFSEQIQIEQVPPHAARVLICYPHKG